jgi:hypothetical protein
MTQHVYIVQHIQLDIIADNFIMQTFIVLPNRKMQK